MSRILKYTFAAVAALALVAGPVSAQDKPTAGPADKPAVETTTIALEVKGMT